jgi:4-amino-4-deoxy-L-arabinose transferase-like glycosyltransferase
MNSGAARAIPRWFESHAFHLATLIVLSALLLFLNLQKGSLSGYDDALYAHEGKQMLLTGDWWTIRDNGILNFEYPPMFVWLEALSMKVWGISDFAAKFPAAVCGLLTIVLVFLIARTWSADFWLPIAGAWVLMLSQYFLKYSMHAMTDVPFTFFFTLSIYCYLKGLQRPHYLIVCGLAIGLAILTRSILGLLPAGVIVGHWLWTRKGPAVSSALVLGVVVAVLAPATWIYTEYRTYGDVFLSNHFSFLTQKAFSNQSAGAASVLRGLVEYPWLLLRLYWPWLPLMLIGLAREIKVMVHREKLSTLLVMWVGVVLIPLSFAEAKVLRYILPVFPAFALLAAIPLAAWISKAQNARRMLTTYCVLCGVVLLIAVLGNPKSRAEEMSTLAPIVDQHTPPGDRVVMFTHGEPRYDYVNQLLWYSHRFSEHLMDRDQLRQQLRSGASKIFVVDAASYRDIVRGSGVNVAVLGQTEGFVCFRTLI